MKKYLVLASILLLFVAGASGGSPCYYRITVEGECDCEHFEWVDCPDGVAGSAVYKQFYGSEILYPIVSDFGETWSFTRMGTFFAIRTSEDLVFCEGIIQNQGAYADPNFLDCDSGSGSFSFDVYGYDPDLDEDVPKFTVTVERICSCEEFYSAIGAIGFDPESPATDCNCDCETNPDCGFEGEFQNNQGPLLPGQNDPGKPLPPINDPVMPNSGALVAPITDFTVAGRQLDIEFTRTYRGDMEDAGFTHTYYSPVKGQKVLLSTNQGLVQRPQEFDYPISLSPFRIAGDGSPEEHNLDYDYVFLEILDNRWQFDAGCFNIDISDVNDVGIVQFESYGSGTISVETDYCIYGTNDPNGGSPLIYFNSRLPGTVATTVSRSFDYKPSRYAGKLGRKWDHSYNISLQYFPGDDEAEPDRYVLLGGNGKRLLFTQDISLETKFVCPSDTDTFLFQTESGFSVSKKGGIRWRFNSDLKISAIEDRNGNQITFSYSNNNLYRVTNDAGKFITFYYDSTNMITHIIDSTGRRFDYGRDADFNLVEVTRPTNKDKKAKYTYAAGNLLLTAIDGDNKVWLENVYDSEQRIIAQRYGDGYFYNTYNLDEDGLVSSVDTIDRAGNEHRVELTKSGLIRKEAVKLDNEWAQTLFYYDFDRTGKPELESGCLIEKIIRPEGDIYVYEYNSLGNTTAIVHKSGESDTGIRTEYTYSNNTWSYPESVTDPAGNTTEYIYDYMQPENYGSPSGRLVAVRLPQAYVSDFNDVEQLILTTPEFKFSYNSYGQVTNVNLPNGIDVRFNYYNGSGKYWLQEAIYDYGFGAENLNATLKFDYDARGNQTSFIDADGIQTQYAYDVLSRITEIVDALNYKTVLTYNRAGRVDTAASQLGSFYNVNNALTAEFTYNIVDNIKTITDTLGRIVEYGYDGNDNITSISDPQGYVDGYAITYGYNSLDLVESITLPENYDASSGSNTSVFSYYKDGLLKSATDAAGNTTEYYYDGYRRLTEAVYPDGTFESCDYNERGLLVRKTNRNGSYTCYGYNALGKLIGKTKGQGGVVSKNSTLIDYLATGQWTGINDPDCISGRYVYSQTDPNATYTMLGFGIEGGRYAVEINWVSFASQSNPNVVVELSDNVVGVIKTYSINQQTDGNRWVYLDMADFAGMPQIKIKTQGDPRLTTIDAVRFTPASVFKYDALGRITRAESNIFTYDRAGRLASTTDGFGRTVGYEYTPAGRRSKLTWHDGFYVTYSYDTVGRLNGITDCDGRLLWTCVYDATGRRSQVMGLYGLTTLYDYENKTGSNDNRGLYLETLSHSLPAGASLKFDYSYDLAGNKLTESINSAQAVSYLYDKNYSITHIDYTSGYDIYFEYDNLLNWISVTEQDATNSYKTNYVIDTLGLNQYEYVDSQQVFYDDNGNLIKMGNSNYLYDNQNRLIAYYKLEGDPNEVSVSIYGYDVFGRRLSIASAEGINNATGAITKSFLYDGEQVIGEFDIDAERIKRRFVYAAGIDEPICLIVEPDHQGWYGFSEFAGISSRWLCEVGDACYDEQFDYSADGVIDFDDVVAFVSSLYLYERPLIEDTKRYGYVFDGSGNVAALTFCNDPNETGNPNEQPYFFETYAYDAFGKPYIYDSDGIAATKSAVENPYMFTARRYDNESGLYYYRMRMYSPELGRFIQPDPIGYYDSMNLYQYCGNNPVNFTDPWGLSKVGDDVADWARRQIGNPIYGKDAPEHMYSKFIRDAYRNAGAPFPNRWWNRMDTQSRFWPLYPSLEPPTQFEMVHPDYRMPNYPSVNSSGKKITASDLQPGDIITFIGRGKLGAYGGIYLGDGQIATASILRPGVIVGPIDPVEWEEIFNRVARVRRYVPTP